MDDYISANEDENQSSWILEKYECSEEDVNIYMSYWVDGYPHWQCLVQAGLADPPY